MLEKLLNYQEVDGKLRAIEQELSKSEERNKFALAKKFLEGAPEQLDKLDSRAGELLRLSEEMDSLYKALEAEIKEFESLDLGEDLDGLGYYKKNALKLGDKIKDLKYKINSIKEETAQVAEQFDKKKRQTILMQRQYNEFGVKYRELKESKKGEEAAVKKELEAAEKGISPDLIAKYKAKRQDKIYPVVYPLSDKRCGQCGMELSLKELSRFGAETLIECENCRRLLYSPK